ncbi:PAS domain-containing sensor histidine kinase [Arcticibacterium luteifluviistationis]|uniref:histidine kinase n=1 Tax=Arcticibacterium luteifluviistationis TaxID=1784714 RepID=A0A2Z4GCY5_9BACT|nr:PAS domain-containing sensor histidine kinase [Arcticibacterium luteifluviistationis]AWV99096.1 hybrid sensor histidine kinase/response regulator [Arcticibacterium luteifluviistationis]
MSGEEEIQLLKRRVQREKDARKAAELILEEKALELYNANKELQNLNESLAKEVDNRTTDLKVSKKRYQQLVESADEIIYELDAAGKILYANPIAYRILEVSKEELIGKSVMSLLEESHVQPIIDSFINCVQNGIKQAYIEYQIVKKNGDKIWLGQSTQYDFVVLNGENSFVGARAIARDITEKHLAQEQLRRSEEKYRRIMENMDLGFLEIDLNGNIIRAYNRFCVMSGYQESELIGKNATDVLVLDKYRAVVDENKVARLDGLSNSYEIQIRKKNGESLWVLISGGPVYSTRGKIVGSVKIHFDLTEQKRVQQELSEAKQKAEEAERVEKEFLANMSHEIRTPLNAIIGMSHLLYDTRPTPEQVEYFEVINNSANFLHHLISDVLDMAKIGAGKMEAKNEPFDLVGLLKTVEKTYELKLGNRPIELINLYDTDIDYLVSGDETLLNQILLNLVGNSEKFTKEGYIKLETKVTKKEGRKTWFRFSISDTGIGIDKEKQKLIFEKFKQVTSKENAKTKGTGLGLAIVKELVHILGGAVDVDENTGGGTIFTFEIPFEITTIKRSEPLVHAQREKASFEGLSVLLVEDNVLNRRYASTLLKKWNLTIFDANDGLEAISMSNKRKYDLILMDIQMPNLNGYEASIGIRNVANPNQDTPIIAITASAMSFEKSKALDAGMNDILTKPFTPPELEAVLNKYLNIEKSLEAVKPQEKEIDMTELDNARLVEIYGDDLDFKKMVFQMFVDELPNQIEELVDLNESKRWHDLALLAHKMKPAFGMVGLSDVEDELKRIEAGIKNDGISENIEGLINEVLTKLPGYQNLIKNELTKM